MKQLYTTIFIIIFTGLSVSAQDMYVNSSNGLNLRKGPGTQFETVASIPSGSKVIVLKKEGDWSKVKYNNLEGYVLSKHLGTEKPKNNAKQNNSSSQRTQKTSANSNQKTSGTTVNHRYRYGLGLRLGDPAGITGIKFLKNNKALELSIGRTGFWGYDFNKRFYKYDDFKHYTYVNSKMRSATAIQLHYLAFKNIDGGLQWYYGFGGQINFFTVNYYYRYNPNNGNWNYRWEKATDVNFGLDGTLGLNYNFNTAPLSIFTDLTLFAELYDDPFKLWFKAGIGIRYNF